ncbi:MAG: HPr family phosphocarrier protein [Lachnospiraceae bacterium]|nr:HPr family phosphocarrier protein [Lachnospiraceae bacterium]
MKIKIKLNTINEVKKFCDYAESLDCDIYASQGRYTVSAKSIMVIMSLSLLDNLELVIDEPSDDFDEFLNNIKQLGIVKN